MKSIDLLKSIKKQVFTAKDAKEVGVSTRMLHHLIKLKHIERLAHGVYTFADTPPIAFQEILTEKVASAPNSVVGLYSALQVLSLTDDPASEIHLIVPHSNKPKKQLEDVVLHKRRCPLKELDTFKQKELRITGLEQTIVDLLKYGEPIGSVRKSLEAAKRCGIEINFSKLIKLGEKFRAKGKVKQLLETLDEN